MRPSKIRDWMSQQVISIGPEAEIHQAVERLLKHGISGLPVVDAAGTLLGILTEQDCLRAEFGSDYHQMGDRRVEEVMTREVRCLEAGADVLTAIQAFLSHPFRRFPVLEHGRLVGIISRRDALRVLRPR